MRIRNGRGKVLLTVIGSSLRMRDLQGANLQMANLDGMDLAGSNLEGAHLEGASLQRANLEETHLEGIDLAGSHLEGANLHGASLQGANLARTHLQRANLQNTNLHGAALDGAFLDRANIQGANLHGARFSVASMTTGEPWWMYLTHVVPALLTAGGKALEGCVPHWDYHNWGHCPMSWAFDATTLQDVPVLLRPRALQFMQLFDAGLLPCPVAQVAQKEREERDDGSYTH